MEPTTSTTARDELAKTATSAFYDSGTNLRLMTAVLRLAWFRVADAILAAGYRKPRAITTAEELDALPMGAAILDSRRAVWVNDGDTVAPWASLGEANYEGGPIWVHSVDITLPATVLWEPSA